MGDEMVCRDSPAFPYDLYLNHEIRIPLLPMVYGGQPFAEPHSRGVLFPKRDGGLPSR